MPISLASAVDRRFVTTGSDSEHYLMLTLEASGGPTPRLSLNLALAIDTSGSMAGEKLHRAQEAASQVVRHLTAADRVAVVSYSDGVRIVAPSTELTASAKTDLLWRLSRMEAGGMTNLSGGWLTACQGVAKYQRGEEQVNRVLLLTDGLANVGITDPGELLEHARQLRLRGITTSTMGVGVDFNEELLEGMARHGGGRFQYVETAKHIPDCVGGELGELLQLAARNVAVEVGLPEGVTCAGCLNEYLLEDTPWGVRVHIGDLLAGASKRAVLKLRVSVPGGDALLRIGGLALYTDTGTGRGTEQKLPEVELHPSAPASVGAQLPDADVEREVMLLLAARARDEAVRLSRLGEDSAAASALGAASRSLSMSAYSADATISREIGALMSLAQDAGRGLREHQRKELRYQAYLSREARSRYDPPQG